MAPIKLLKKHNKQARKRRGWVGQLFGGLGRLGGSYDWDGQMGKRQSADLKEDGAHHGREAAVGCVRV